MTSQSTITIGISAAFVRLIAALIVLSAVASPAQQASTSQQSAKSSTAPTPADQTRILDTYGKLPLSFEANRGQADARVKFLSRTAGYSLFLTGDEAVLTLSMSQTNTDKPRVTATSAPAQPGISAPKAGPVLRMKLRNANPAAKITGVDELAGTSNYFIGNDPSKWRTSVPTYAKVKYEEIYSGIDLVYYGNQRQLEYDFIVAPGADPRRIAFDIRGAKRIRREEHGDLVLTTGKGEIRWQKPVVYQEKNGARQQIAARYAIADKNRVAFEVAEYDASKPLYIDPLIYSTYLGGSAYGLGNAIAVDSAGNAYVTGSTASANFPTTPGAFQKACGSCPVVSAFITKLNPSGSALVYSTYLGGSGNDFGGDQGTGIAVDSSGNAYVTGGTTSRDFPITPGAFQTAYPGALFGDAFVTKLNPAGSALVYSSYLGGSGSGSGAGIAVDSAGNAYVTGSTESTDFPITPGAFQTTSRGGARGFVTKFNLTGSALVYSTYLGGSGGPLGGDQGFGITVDSFGNAYVTGGTDSRDFPTTPGAFQSVCDGGGFSCSPNAFVTKFNPTGSALIYSTYLGGSANDTGTGIAVDSSGNAYLTGGTESSDFPVTPGAFQTTCGGGVNYYNCWDAFITEINSTGSALVYSTYLGGNYNDWGYGIALDSNGNIYVTGSTASTNFPTIIALQPANSGPVGFDATGNAFVAKFSPGGSALVYSTYLGGSGNDSGSGVAADSSGNTYVVGPASSANFPTANPLQPFLGGTNNTNPRASLSAFVAKISAEPSNVTLFPLHLNFVGQQVGSVGSSQVSKLINAGSDALAVTSISVVGANRQDFAQTNNCSTSVPAGTSCSITVTFTPKAAGNRSASVSIAAPDSPQSLSLTGFGKYTTSTAISSSPNPSPYGQAATFTASVSSPGGALPLEDLVIFNRGSNVLGSAFLIGGTASFTTSSLPTGILTITANYLGDADFTASISPALPQVVDAKNQSPTSTTLSSSLNPSLYGQKVTWTATTTALGPLAPTGKVKFTWAGNFIGSATLDASGVATLTYSDLNADPYPLTATYEGDANNGPSVSAILNQVVQRTTSATTLTSSPNPSAQGQAVTFTAKITSPTTVPKGPVTFTVGNTVLGSVELSGGKATFTTSTLAAGSTTVTATYSGDSNISKSSASVTQTVQ